MNQDELLKRLDSHLARGNTLMAHNTRAFEDLSSFLHDQTLALQGLQREIRGQTNVIREHSNLLRDHSNVLREHTNEMTAELRAGREALFRMLDRLERLDGGEPGPAGA